MAAYQNYRSQFGDTTFTKVFVGGLAWETPTESMRRYFDQFGEILEAVIITDKNTGRSKGYGFVTFRDPDSARRACLDPNPVIDGRRTNCNIAYLGRPRPSPPRGRNQAGNPYHGGATSYTGVSAAAAAAAPPPPPPPPPAVMYPPYGYATYTPDYGYHQSLHNPQFQAPQYYQQVYGASTSASPFYYGYSLQAAARGTFYTPQAHRIQGSTYLHYPAQHWEGGSFTTFPPPPPPLLSRPRQSLSLSTDSQTPQQTSRMEVGVTTSESQITQ